MESTLREVFLDSMESIGLNTVKYDHLPFNLRRTNMSYHIYNEISQCINEVNLKDDSFYEKELYHFTKGEIENHYKTLNGCIALVCLGHTNYSKLLLTYLDFPEARWTIKINYLLNSLLSNNENTLKIPSYSEKIEIQSAFIKREFYSDLKDLSYSLLNHKTNVNYPEYLLSLSASKRPISELNISLKDNNKLIEDDMECSEFFYLKTHEYLKTHQYNTFIVWMIRMIHIEKVPFINTITKSIRDVFYELQIHKSPNFWIKELKKERTNILASIFIYNILKQDRADKRLAARFVKAFISDKLNKKQLDALSELYQCNHSANSILKISEFLNDSSNLPISVKVKIDVVSPIFLYCIKNNIVNIYLSEKESLNLISQKNKGGSTKLFKVFKTRFKYNTNVLTSVATVYSEKDEDFINFYPKISILIKMRADFEATYMVRKSVQVNLKNYYIKLFESWVEETTKLENENLHLVSSEDFT
ncbi:MAG: hypothetical protein ABIN95_12855 [Mucilaginibacter sp.]